MQCSVAFAVLAIYFLKARMPDEGMAGVCAIVECSMMQGSVSNAIPHGCNELKMGKQISANIIMPIVCGIVQSAPPFAIIGVNLYKARMLQQHPANF